MGKRKFHVSADMDVLRSAGREAAIRRISWRVLSFRS